MKRTLKARWRLWVRRWGKALIENAQSNRDPDFVVGPEDAPYLNRWWLLPRNRWFNIYLHQFLRDDDDRALHDHPWHSLSIILRGRYIEHRINEGGVQTRTEHGAGRIIYRSPRYAHRLELPDTLNPDTSEPERTACWTLFLTGPRLREWGFHCPNGWRHWSDFTQAENPGATGRGCE